VADDKKKSKTTRERLEEKKQQKAAPPPDGLTFLQRSRGYLDALVFAFLLAMFIRTYVFELFIIPTGSMTPTLIGDKAGEVAMEDYDGDGVKDVIYAFPRRSDELLQIFLMNEDATYKDQIFLTDVSRREVVRLVSESHRRSDMIIVNKFAYWFSEPDRADIAVFKVPYRPGRNQSWEVDKPVYIKRVIGLPDETVTIQPVELEIFGIGDPNRYSERWGGREVHLLPKPILFDGDPLRNGVLGDLIHYPRKRSLMPSPNDPFNVEEVTEDGVLMLGDNANSSSDGRYWGDVPLNHLRGKAILRYFPLGAAGFLDKGRSADSE